MPITRGPPGSAPHPPAGVEACRFVPFVGASLWSLFFCLRPCLCFLVHLPLRFLPLPFVCLCVLGFVLHVLSFCCVAVLAGLLALGLVAPPCALLCSAFWLALAPWSLPPFPLPFFFVGLWLFSGCHRTAWLSCFLPPSCLARLCASLIRLIHTSQSPQMSWQ